MKDIGVTRKLDHLGRIVVPVEARRELGGKIANTLKLVSLDNMFCSCQVSRIA